MNINLLSLKPILEFAAVFVVGVMSHVAGVFSYIKRPDYPKMFTASELLLKDWIGAMSGIFVVLLVALNQPNGFASVGIYLGNGERNGIAVFWGWFVVSILLIALGLGYKLLSQKGKEAAAPAPDPSGPGFTEQLQYRDRWERGAYLTVLPLVVISEDLIYRGYFVLLLGNRTGMPILWAIFSVIMSVIIHLYQGRTRKVILFHLLAASFFVGLTVVTQNILAPIAAHLYYNLITTTQTWKRAKKVEPASTPLVQRGIKQAALIGFIGVNIIVLCTAMTWLLFY